MPSPSGIDDPALVEELRTGSADEELSVIVRLSDPNALPPGARVITRFGDIATVRVEKDRLQELAESATVRALEASRNLRPSHQDEEGWHDDAIDEGDESEDHDPSREPSGNTRRPDGVQGTGKNILVAVLDWGVDPCHPAFQHEDGSTRIISLWDQRGTAGTGPGNRWGYGRILTREDIDRALRSDDPYRELDYHPAEAGGSRGAHGTHVLDIAAGSGLAGGMPGVAPEADLVFVHLARTTDVLGEGNLGDSASVLEALDHVFSIAGERPCVVNMSVGAHGGPHDGETLVELGLDRAVSLAPGRAVVNSAGNYRTRRAHTMGRVTPGEPKTIPFRVPHNDTHDSELEVFYPSIDQFTAEVIGPDETVLARLVPGQDSAMVVAGTPVGHVYHRVRYGTGGDHHIDVLLRPDAPGGVWSLRLIGESVYDGRYHAWIERDRGLQPTFLDPDVVTSSTTGTLCNARLSLTCGCVNAYAEPPILATFSSGGPTRDGRVKPELVAPGSRIRAARSTPRGAAPGARYVSKSGTSMAAPHLAGTVALMYEAAGIPLEIYDTRALLFASADPSPFFARAFPGPDLHRFGYGMLDIVAAERAARDFGRESGVLKEKDAESLAAWEVVEEPSVSPAQEVEEEAEPETNESYEPAGLMEETTWPESLDDGSPDLLEDGGDVTEPIRRSDILLSDLGNTSWVESAEELKQLAFQSLSVDPERPLVRISDPAGTLHAQVEPGDLLVRSAPLPGGQYSAVIVSEHPESRWSLLDRGVQVEPGGSGWFVQVVEIPLGGGAPQTIGRRLTDGSGRVPRYQTVLRPTTPHDPAAEEDARPRTPTTPAVWPFYQGQAVLDTSAQLEWEDLTRIPGGQGNPRLYYVVTGAPSGIADPGYEGSALFNLRVRNTNSVYNHQDVRLFYRVLDVLPDRQFRQVHPEGKQWIIKRYPELEDESSRPMPIQLTRKTLLAAYNSESPRTRLEVEYRWRESGESHWPHVNRTGLDFMLMAPVEFMFSQKKRLTPKDIKFNDLETHRDDYWISIGGVEFTPELRKDMTLELEVSHSVSQQAEVEQTTSSGASVSKTRGTETSNSFTSQVSGELTQGGSIKATVKAVEIGLEKMIKLGVSYGFTHTTTRTQSETFVRESARSLRLSRAYVDSQTFTRRQTVTISPPIDSEPTRTGRKKQQPGSGEKLVRAYLYPTVAYFEVPYVRYSGVNKFGQATRRSEGVTIVPSVTGWVLTTRRE